MKITRNIILSFALLFALISCCKEEKFHSAKTILIYMAANNNLSSNAFANLESIEKGYVPEYVDAGEKGDVLLVYYHITSQAPRLYRLYSHNGTITQEIVREYDSDQNSCTPEVLHEVLSYAYSIFPGDENGLVLWSHGTGWLPKGYYSNPVYSSTGEDGDIFLAPMAPFVDPDAHWVKSYGSENSQEIEIADICAALPTKYSFILFDACLMGCVEVAYELKDKCDYMISSPAEILTAGFPYDVIMGPLFAGEPSDLQEVCRNFYEFYNSQTGTKKSATISLVCSKELDGLAGVVSSIMNDGGREKIQDINMSEVQRYFRNDRHWFYDIDSFMSKISDTDKYTSFVKALQKAVPYKAATPWFMQGSSTGFEIKTFSGLSTYVPNPENLYLDDYYRTLSWNKAVGMVE